MPYREIMMDINTTELHRHGVNHALGRAVLSIARSGAYGLLWLLRPVLVPLLFWLAIGGVLLWVVFVLIAGDSDFPSARVLAMSASCLSVIFAYTVTLEWLRAPRRS